MINVTSKMDRFTAFALALALVASSGLIALGAYARITGIAPEAGFDLAVQGSITALVALALAIGCIRIRFARKA